MLVLVGERLVRGVGRSVEGYCCFCVIERFRQGDVRRHR